ncbi:RNA polymerase sigma factor [Polymorphobacter fuscus]|uniref:Sigma-70 family RNA polymerase sigma factor n=1 Tax=Sandarakinorhabdus fusca TaxID=1439888 RepID=A0A7C9GPI9_9SPHN|nr:RNA polymerase sigma factor [Polymorphobacter fuscus]KAB7647472.1 RNA polymerase sigma factor [Polymorphobacter fuscus]MQT16730.1 sigma-70 family RNA polymerase sigma factor [Polymorphobacter fuscus]NJC09283.1 RNA polymerase sigma-70 factor (ECF subfamily) [Polymorphobacter fuscus]
MPTPLADCSDGELGALALKGRQAAYGELMRRYREPVYRLVRSHVGDPDEALDIVQEAFVAAFASIGRYDGSRPFRHWINRISLNKCRDWARRRAVRRLFRFALPLDAASESVDPAVTGEAVIDDVRALARVTKAIAALPANLKEPLILTAVDGLSQAEAASVLGISEKAVEVRIYRARRMLTGQVEKKR